MSTLIKKEIDEWLDDVSYELLNSNKFYPSAFSLRFASFIKLVNGDTPESNKTPPYHLAMLDKLNQPTQYILNLCFRGSGKTTLFIEYLAMYCAIFNELPYLKDLDSIIYVADTMESGAKNARKNIESRYERSAFLQEYLPVAKFTDSYIEFTNKEGRKFGIKLYGATTGIRGTKIFAKRPKLAILDDLFSDEAAESKVVRELIKKTVYRSVNHALDPKHRKVILCGTPFNKDDIIISAVESGAWNVNAWPVCERFPCPKEEFKGAWEDRFSYTYVKDQYDFAVATGDLAGFNQELMLRISSDDDRLVQDSEIRWYKREPYLSKKDNYNFYITTDFATSAKQSADFTVISVWLYDGSWKWIDGVCAKQTMDVTINDLFKFVKIYHPQAVGIEVTGQQQGFIPWIQNEMATRDIWFTLADDPKTHSVGIRPTTDKLTRFNLALPFFKSGNIFFPQELRNSAIMNIFMQQLKLATRSGIKGKDDCLDTISMLASLRPWKITEETPKDIQLNMFGEVVDDEEDCSHNIDSYIV